MATMNDSRVIPYPTIAQLRSHSLARAAQQEIERLILGGELGPGAKLTEAWLSERLGVSRGPIREAFRMLEEAGLVRLEKNRGVFVRDIPLDEAVEIYDLRAVMDELVGRSLATRITGEQMKALRAIVERMDAAARADDADTYHLLNLQFLKAIASGDPEAAGRAMFDHVIESKERMLDGEAARTAPARARAGKKG